MKVLDTTFLIDYEAGHPGTKAYLQSHVDEEFVMPSTVYLEFLLGDANVVVDPDLDELRAKLDWADVLPVSKRTADAGAAAVSQLGSQSPNVDGTDASVVGLAIEVDGAIVAGDSDLTHERTRHDLPVDVETY
ncbi:MAG: PIN domain-containing protein [Halobacteriales archaeon]